MMKRVTATQVTVFALLLCVFLAGGAAEAKKKKKQKNVLGRPVSVEALSGPVTLSSVNERWMGAKAQTRVNLPIKKGSDGEGWSHSEWLLAEGERIKMRFSVNSRDALWEVLPQKNLLAGVHLVCEGWSVQNPKKGQGIQVDFRFSNYPARARAEFNTDLEHLSEVERFLRYNVMAVTRADEQLTSVAAVPAPAAVTRPEATAAPASVAAAVPAVEAMTRTLDIISAEVRPAVVGAGGEVELVIEYAVSSGDGGVVDVSESRTVSKATSQIASFASQVERASGTYTSAQSIRIPDDAAAGFYSFKAEVSFAELKDEYTALFEIN